MGLYGSHIFPRLMEWTIGSEQHMEYRREALAPAAGTVLEIGFGTGLNLACYPEAVERVVGVEPETMLEDRLRRRIAAAPMPVELLRLDASRRLPVEDGTFDTAVSTWTLCTIPDAGAALREVRRALSPGGRFLFMEHGRSDSPRVARWQDRLNPVQNVVGCGCNLNRRIDALILEAGFEITGLERFRLPKVPRISGEVYRGEAVPVKAAPA